MISNLSVVAGLQKRMLFLQNRQRLLAGNVANVDTPGYKPLDLKENHYISDNKRPSDVEHTSSFGGMLSTTDSHHIAGVGLSKSNINVRGGAYVTRPSGNSVNLETEMMKVSQNQTDFDVASNFYRRMVGFLKIGLGRKP